MEWVADRRECPTRLSRTIWHNVGSLRLKSGPSANSRARATQIPSRTFPKSRSAAGVAHVKLPSGIALPSVPT